MLLLGVVKAHIDSWATRSAAAPFNVSLRALIMAASRGVNDMLKVFSRLDPSSTD